MTQTNSDVGQDGKGGLDDDMIELLGQLGSEELDALASALSTGVHH